MKLKFTKMHGCGNDYIYFDCFDQTVEHPEALAVKLSDRHFGIGGDGIVLICPSRTADARMRMFNLDGSEGNMCGNAIRCVGKYLYDVRGIHKTRLSIETRSGVKSLDLTVQDGQATLVQVDMGVPQLSPDQIPVLLEGDKIVDHPITVDGSPYRITCVSMGNPHCVVFCDEVEHLPLSSIGPQFEQHSLFPQRVNTEFVHVIDPHTIWMRVWERGSGETFACGTGACASVVACVLNGLCPMDEDIRVLLRGGTLTIRYTKKGVFMTGTATKVFDGTVQV
ncbi:diaminopimelate epimerase [[Clostridium] leptum]|nr:diaminopimelate epimerase [[Clostridium] leptum]